MDDHTMAWPNYKFGFKHHDLTTTLHEQYNTFTSTIQDPEAFHHDVWEISHEADTTDEFHRLMAERRDQRLHELNDTMASLAVEIISNPKLIDSKHWKFALQLFRTKSFDSIVRYFASYLPDSEDIPHHTPSVSSSFSEAPSERTAATSASTASSIDTPIFFDHDDLDEGLGLTQEPCSLDDDDVDQCHNAGAPLSPPESEPYHEQRSVDDFESHRSTSPVSRSMSFSGSESGVFPDRNFIQSCPSSHDDVESIPDERDTAVASLTDIAGSPSSIESADDYHQPTTPIHTFDDDDEFDLPPTQFPEDDFDAFELQHDDTQTPTLTIEVDGTPTPRQETLATSYMEYKSATKRLPSPHRRSVSPNTSQHTPSSVSMMATRRSPEESLNRISKPAFNGIQKKRGMRGLD